MGNACMTCVLSELVHAWLVSLRTFRWVGAARGREKDQQVQIIRDLSALAENVDAVQYMSSSVSAVPVQQLHATQATQ